jgi:hypothetical protein
LRDGNGNQTQRIQAATTEEFGFDYMNRLSSYKKSVDSNLASYSACTISPTGDRFAKKDLLNFPGTPEERHMYDGRDVVTDYTYNGSVLSHARGYVQTQDIDSKVARVEADETYRYYIGDALGR